MKNRGRWPKFAAALALLVSAWFVARFWQGPILEAYSYSRQVLARDGKLLRFTLSGDEKYRVFTPLDEIPPSVKEAVLLQEDRWFYFHPGINPWSLVKAAVETYSGDRRMGGSTITMQLARMTSTRGSKTIGGKIAQIGRALHLELFHSKNEILEAYLNLLPYGANVEGIGAASFIYFGKSPKLLTTAEVLSLTVIPQNPNARSFLGSSQASLRSKEARASLQKAWLEQHPEDRNINLEMDLPLASKRLSGLPFAAPHFSNLVLERRVSGDFRQNGKLETTLDLEIQTLVERKVSAYVNGQKRLGINNASVLVLDSETMEVLALVGSADFFDKKIQGQVNGVLGKRSPGSSLKPFTFALAMDQGLIHPMTLLKDTPMSFGGFDPENFDKTFSGPLSATDALIHSRNVPAVFLTSLLKSPSFYDFLKSSGIKKLREPTYYGLAMSLGGAEVTMEELSSLYAMLANKGELKPLRYLKTDPLRTTARLLSPEASFLTLDMLRKNLRNDQKYTESWIKNTVPIAWKTGTSHGFRDAWTTGVAGRFVISVWLGNFEGEGNPALIGRELAAPLFFSIVDGLRSRAQGEPKWLSRVDLNVKKVKVCALSGHLPGKNCRNEGEAWFIPGKSPISSCEIHREVLISTRSGLRGCELSRGEMRKEIFEVWPSDLLQIFRVAGIPRKTPPAFEPECRKSDTQITGLAPNIVSPRKEVVYTYRSGESETPQEIVPLAAVADGDARSLHWFVGSEYLGKTDPQKPLLWKPKPGRYVVRVVDDLGRSDARDVDVKVTQ